MLKFRLAVCFAVLALSSCGITYVSPRVQANDTAFDVNVVAMSPRIVSVANKKPYQPRRLPASFIKTAGSTAELEKIQGAPDQLDAVPSAASISVELNLPPQIDAKPYTIGVGDVLRFATLSPVVNGSELATGISSVQSQQQIYSVRDDGAVSIPEVGIIALEGLTLEEAEARVFQKLVQNQLDPEFSLEVTEFRSKRVSIGGAVRRPAVVPITLNPLRLDEAISSAGGITLQNNDFGVIRIYRNGALYQIPLRDYLNNPHARQTPLTDKDSIFVDGATDLTKAREFYSQQIDAIGLQQAALNSALANLNIENGLRRADLEEKRNNFRTRLDLGSVERDFVYLTGEVSKQSRWPLPFENKASLADVLYENGGLQTSTGSLSQVYVLRHENGTKLTAFHLDAKNVVNLVLATKFEMRPNDIVFVREQQITVWGRALQQAFPTLINIGAARIAN